MFWIKFFIKKLFKTKLLNIHNSIKAEQTSTEQTTARFFISEREPESWELSLNKDQQLRVNSYV